jgi:putative MATE family efflux protein
MGLFGLARRITKIKYWSCKKPKVESLFSPIPHEKKDLCRNSSLIEKQGTLSLIWDAIRGKEHDYTEGSINRAIILLAIPMMLEMVMESLFAITDVFFVAKLGQDAVATVGLTETMIMVIESLAIGISAAATAVVARRIGEKNKDLASNAAFQAIVMAAALAIFLGLPGYLFAEDILRLLGGSEDLISMGKGYTRIMLGWNITLMMLFMMNAVFRGAGNAAIAMRTLWLANGINIVLDPCLILGLGPFPELGLEGAAIATNIGRGTGVLFQLYILLKGSTIVRLGKKYAYLSKMVLTNLFKISLGGTGQYLISTASWIFLVRIIAVYGSGALAGYTIAFRIIIFSVLPSWGLANATATLVGQNLGAKQPDRAETTVWRAAHFNAIFLALISVAYFLFAYELIAIFDEDNIVLSYGSSALQIICSGYVFFSYGMIMSQAFNGAGDTRTPTLINIGVFWLVQVPLAYFMSGTMGMGATGVFYAMALSLVLWAVVAIIVFRKGKWKLVEV